MFIFQLCIHYINQIKLPQLKLWTTTDTPSGSFESIEIDTIWHLRPYNNCKYTHTINEVLIKYIIAHPIPSKDPKKIAKTLVDQWFLKYGLFETLKSNNRTLLKNDLMKNFCKLLNTNQVLSTSYYHETVKHANVCIVY